MSRYMYIIVMTLIDLCYIFSLVIKKDVALYLYQRLLLYYSFIRFFNFIFLGGGGGDYHIRVSPGCISVVE